MAEMIEGNIEHLCEYFQIPRDRHAKQTWRTKLQL